MSQLKYRVLVIVALCLVSVWALFPRDVTIRERRADGLLHDTVTRHVPLRQGLDLKGGTYLQLEVNDSAGVVVDKAEAIDRALKTVRTRIEGIGVSESVVQKEGNNRIVVQIPGIQDPERARRLVQEQAFLEFKITDKTQALERNLARIDQIIKTKGVVVGGDTAKTAALTPATRGLQGLLTDTGAAKKDTGKKVEAVAKKDSTDSLKIQAGGAFSSLLQQGSMQGEFYVEVDKIPTLEKYLSIPEVRDAMPPGKQLLPSTDSTVLSGKWYRAYYVVDSKAIMTGADLTDARPAQDPTEGNIVQFQLNNEGGRRFKNETGKHIHDYMAIILDSRVMGRPPIIQSAIGTRGQITMGGKDLAAAQDLSLVLRAGALPVPLRVAEVRSIGPSMGQDSINAGIRAGVIAVVLVILIMVVYYRFSGVLAVAALGLYVLYTLAALAGFDAVLTMPGLAGFVLSIGIAVDANVLIFERIRESSCRAPSLRECARI